ncbi:putative set domain-containing protein [Lasiodiplodia theobromae]|uniref:Ribosomal lysine N-methyltransferase 4 n=2 Tax=Lasiodiplodia theobromae TaxID=45133 RepID=A0A5N5DF43_9PEZI|nr:Ribosomal lysine N-methyltransferase 4 [Lasiodiplodia theobromae]KAF9632003.1 putative set domain-containing protein [Lasiodiplodia theobromae]
MALQDDFQERSAAFMRWLPSASATVSDKVKLDDLRHRRAGRGLVAVQDIQEGEVLFAIPRSAVLSAANSSLSTTLPQIFEELDPWGSLIVTMIYEYLRGDASPWKPYFDVLPTDFDTLMFWSDDELAELQASAVLQKIGKDSANELFNGTVIPLLRRHADVFFPDPASAQGVTEDQLLALAHRMGSTIMAYAFDIEPDQATKEVDEEGYASEEEDEALPKGMVPLADMLNADADRNNARLHYGPDVLTMEAIADIKAGDEIFNDYGPLPRSDLVRRYGYCTPFYEQYDVVEIPTDLIVESFKGVTSDQEIEEKLAYLEDQDLLETGYDIGRNPEEDPAAVVSPELGLLLATLYLPHADFQRMQKKGKFPKPDLTPQMAALMQQVVAKRIAQYPTSLAEDMQRVSSGTDLGNARKAMACAVRIGEKEILESAAKLLTKLASDSSKRDGDDVGEGSSNKRRRVA